MHAKSVLKRLSCCHGAEKLSSKQTHISIKMAMLSIASLLSFLSEENKSIKKKEKTTLILIMWKHLVTSKEFCKEKCTQVRKKKGL